MAGLLLDTNVISDTAHADRNPVVFEWVSRQVATDLHLSAVTIGELTRGIERLAPGRNRTRLTMWLEQEILPRFEGRVLPFDQSTATIWGKLMGRLEIAGRLRSALDMQIAAIALRHGMTLATRNTRDFAGTGVDLVNPWTA